MQDPLIEFGKVSKIDFFENISARREDYTKYATVDFDDPIERKKSIDGVYITDVDTTQKVFIADNGIYIKECYDYLEEMALAILKSEFHMIDSPKESKKYIRQIQSELSAHLKAVKNINLSQELQPYKDYVSEKIKQLIAFITQTYIKGYDEKPSGTPKIVWKGSLNQLTTLLFDLWQGQEKLAPSKIKPKLKPLIEAKKQDLMELVANNFLDNEGNPISHHTLSDYFSTSDDKSNQKARSNRIELDYN